MDILPYIEIYMYFQSDVHKYEQMKILQTSRSPGLFSQNLFIYYLSNSYPDCWNYRWQKSSFIASRLGSRSGRLGWGPYWKLFENKLRLFPQKFPHSSLHRWIINRKIHKQNQKLIRKLAKFHIVSAEIRQYFTEIMYISFILVRFY